MKEAFKLKAEVEKWKKALQKQQGLEPGYIEEIESHLYDRIDEFVQEGYSEGEAFNKAISKSVASPEDLANEFYKARTATHGIAPWRKKPTLISRLPMHFKIGFRNLSKRRVYTVLNMLGLAVSICFSIFIWIFVQDQKSYDQHFANANRIYRVIYDVSYADVKAVQADVGQPVGPTLKADYPEVLEVTRTRRIGATNTLSNEDISIESKDFFVTDKNFFKVFSIDLDGDSETALSEPNTIVITEDLALRLLGRTDVIGEVITYSGLRPPMDIKITGVMKNLNSNTHLPVQALISYGTYFDQRELINWLRKSYTYVLLDEGNNIESLRAKIPDFNKRYLEEVFARRADATANLLFQPLQEIYLAEDYLGEPYPHGSQENLKILLTIMLFLLVMASINYVNLTTAQAIDRGAEVGIRKILGSSRRSLLTQFMAESMILAFAAGFLTLLIALPLIPYYNELTSLQFSLADFLSWQNIFNVLLLSIIIGAISGLYPAFYLADFQPQAILKGKFSTSTKGVLLRKILIIAQYAISSVLIIWMVVISQQINFMKNREVGFDKKSLIEIKVPDEQLAMSNVDAFMQRINSLTAVRSSTKTTSDLSYYYGEGSQLMESPDGTQLTTNLGILSVGYDFIKTIGAEFIEGRDFDRTLEDEKSVLINQLAVEKYGWHDRALEVNYLGRDREGNVSGRWKVAGVVSNFKFGEASERAGPVIIYLDNRTIPESLLLVGIEGNAPFNVIPEIASIWEEYFDGQPFDFELIEDKLNVLYAKEEVFLDLLSILGLITAFITTLGIIGLISFSTEMRKKEIALRKICGAQIRSILILLSRQFAMLLTIGLIIGIPISFYITQSWLSNYSLQTDLNAWPYLISLPIALIFTASTLVYHSLRAAKANPIEALRRE